MRFAIFSQETIMDVPYHIYIEETRKFQRTSKRAFPKNMKQMDFFGDVDGLATYLEKRFKVKLDKDNFIREKVSFLAAEPDGNRLVDVFVVFVGV